MKIRAAEKDDIEWINEQYDEVGFVHSVFENEVIAIAECDGQKAGLGRLVAIDEQNGELGGMYVSEAFRGKGIAKEIVTFLLERALKFQNIYCIPFQHLTVFYTRYGFKPCADVAQAPAEIVEKYRWCKEKYPHPTSLLCLRLHERNK